MDLRLSSATFTMAGLRSLASLGRERAFFLGWRSGGTMSPDFFPSWRSFAVSSEEQACISARAENMKKDAPLSDIRTKDVATAADTTSPAALLDRQLFSETVRVVALHVPESSCHTIVKLLKGHLLERQGVRCVASVPHNPGLRLVLLSEDITNTSLEGLPADVRDSLRLRQLSYDVIYHKLTLGYSHRTADYVLKRVLPEHIVVPSSFETIGHIAHINLRDSALPYKRVIAQVLHDKNQPKIRTVVNKVGSIENEFRVPVFEVLAGEDDLETELRQHGATFQLNYGQVYWNSRLEFEHKRLISLFKPKDVIWDMFAGVGPFAVPAAQKGCLVHANDLNPASVRYLRINAQLNKASDMVRIYNVDARAFVRTLLLPPADPLPQVREEVGVGGGEGSGSAEACPANDRSWERCDHVVMNLPASAIEFLDVFRGAFRRECWRWPLPRIHCYCFARSHETDADLIQRAEDHLGGRIDSADVWEVRDVSPNKRMMCLSFNLPDQVAFNA